MSERTPSEKQNKNFTLVATTTQNDAAAEPQESRSYVLKNVRTPSNGNSAQVGEHGRVTSEMIKKYVPDISNAIFYATGSPAFVEAMRTVLDGAGIDSDNVKSEDFAGY